VSYYQGFDPYLIRERNEQIRSEVGSLRLEQQLRKNLKAHRSSGLALLGEWGKLLIGRTDPAH
jgi:hypothetical protein